MPKIICVHSYRGGTGKSNLGFLNKAKPKSEEDFGSYFAKQVQGYCI
jgi:MinD-like ATPase involved in chromosome partitioning or flagellar assembly